MPVNHKIIYSVYMMYHVWSGNPHVCQATDLNSVWTNLEQILNRVMKRRQTTKRKINVEIVIFNMAAVKMHAPPFRISSELPFLRFWTFLR